MKRGVKTMLLAAPAEDQRLAGQSAELVFKDGLGFDPANLISPGQGLVGQR